MTERAWYSRRYRPGDEVELLALFNRVFGKQRSLEHWRWQFASNPYAPPTIVVALRRGDDQVVGSHVLMPIALNASGERVLAGHTLDLVVHEDFRMQGIFQVTARECFTWALERGLRAVIAFPNPQSYPGFVRSLEWSRIRDPWRWDRRIGLRGALGEAGWARALTWAPDRILRTLGGSRSRSEWRADVAAEMPVDHDGLWAECAPGLKLSLWKDREYLAWRYDRNPDHAFVRIALRERGRLRALAVVWREHGRAMICELLCPRAGGAALGRALVQAVCGHALDAGDDRVSFLGADEGFLAGCFTGFRGRPAPENVLVGRGLEPGALDALVREGRNWSVAFGDADYV